MKRFALLLPLVYASLLSAQTSNVPLKEMTIADIYQDGGITGRTPETVQWSPDGTKVSYVLRNTAGDAGELYYIDVATGKPAVLVTAQKLNALAPPASKISTERQEARSRYGVAGYHWAPDAKHLLFDANGQLWLYALEGGIGVQLTSSPEGSSDPKFSPDGKQVTFVRKHNLYVHSLAPNAKEQQLTRDVSEDLLNGEVDWLYEEELDVRSNYFWSPDSKQIVFLQMNEKQVPSYAIEDFIPQHPAIDHQKYPYAGDINPSVRLGVVGAGGGNVKWVELPEKSKDIYIPRFGWVKPGMIWAQVLDRNQDKIDLYFVDLATGKAQNMLSEKSDTWVEVHDDFQVLKSGDQFLWTSWRDGHTHLYLYSFDKQNPLSGAAKLVRQLTQGDFEMTGVDTVDEKSGTVYFTATAGDDRQRNLLAIQLDGTNFRRISQPDGTHKAEFAPASTYYVDSFSSQLAPPQLALCKVGGTCDIFFKSKTPADSGYEVRAPEFIDFKADDGTVLHGELLLPKNIPAGHKVPLLLNPYGGPGAMTVVNQWGSGGMYFDDMLASDGIAVLHVDNRGMGFRGKKFTAALRHNMGEIELKDQIAALDQVLAAHPELDGNRVGFWGWSYGGYFTIYALEHSQRFIAGFAVAPVTDWHQYDSTYTERYMGLPKDDADGYVRSSPQKAAATLHGDLTIAHGTGDDNVHMQNTIQMIEALTNAGKQYSLVLYPRKTHGISGKAARIHLFTRIRSYFNQELGTGKDVMTGERKHE